MIRLITVIGHGLDLLPHFIKHYSDYVDEIHIIIYESPINPNIKKQVREIIKDYSNIKIVETVFEEEFRWDYVTFLYNKNKKEYPDDWWVIADIDEFHLYPFNSLKKIIKESTKNGWDIIRGGFIDRIGNHGNFSKIDTNTNRLIWSQFPNGGFFRYPLSGACPNKIAVCKGYVELTSGQHYAKIGGDTTWRWQGWNHPLINPKHHIQVHHFKWDSTAIERIKRVAETQSPFSFSHEYALMYESLKKRKFKINIKNKEFMFERVPLGDYFLYKKWDYLINKIKSI